MTDEFFELPKERNVDPGRFTAREELLMREHQNSMEQNTRRRYTRSLVGVAAGIAIVAVLGVSVVNVTDNGSASDMAADPTAGSTALDPKLVLASSEASVRNARGVIVHSTATEADPRTNAIKERSEVWYDASDTRLWRSDLRDADNKLSEQFGAQVKDGVYVSRHVDYANKTVTDTSEVQVAPVFTFPTDANDASYVGSEDIDGVKTLHFQQKTLNTFDFWIAADSKLPVRIRQTSDVVIATSDYDWQPRTSAAVETLMVAAPKGFALVPPSASMPTASTTLAPQASTTTMRQAPTTTVAQVTTTTARH